MFMSADDLHVISSLFWFLLGEQFFKQNCFPMAYSKNHTFTLLTGFKLGPDSPGKLGRSDSKIGPRSYIAKL